MNLWQRIASFLVTLFGVQTMPPEVQNNDTSIQEWWAIYRAKAPWINYSFVTADGVKRQRNRLSMNAAKVICAELAGLVVSEPPTVDASKSVLDVLYRENFWTNIRKNLEYQHALGGQAIKIVRENEVISLDFVKAANFIPLTWDNSQITEASFIDRRSKGKDVFIRVETHKKTQGGYTITSAAFDEKTGVKQNLGILWPNVEPEVFVETPVPLFVYISNPEANNIDPESPVGISIYANAVDTLQAIDMAFDGMKTEILMGRQRVALPGTVMRGYTDPTTGTKKLGFDPTDEAYIRLESDDADKLKPVDLTGQMRMEQWRMAIQSFLDLLAVQIGFSSGYFSFDGVSMKTATEVISENSRTYKTVESIKESLNSGLIRLFQAIDILSGGTGENISITWQDGIVEDRNSKAKYHQDLVLAGLEDTVTALMAVHEVDESQAMVMADKIKAEKTVVNAVDLGI